MLEKFGINTMRACTIIAHLILLAADSTATIIVSGTPPANASTAIPEAFVSYSIEFAFFPDFAGNCSTHHIAPELIFNRKLICTEHILQQSLGKHRPLDRNKAIHSCWREYPGLCLI